MRQRTISDYFWLDPEISDLSQEDKATLLYFLTSPHSNIIGVYRIVWRIAAAEMGWTTDQLLVVVKRLQIMGLIDFTDDSWVWVKIWWKHNSAAGAFSPKLLASAKKQCASMPAGWLDEFLKSLESLELTGLDRVLIGYGYPTDTLPPNTNTNTNCNSNSISTTTTASPEDVPGCAVLEFPRELSTEEKKKISASIREVKYLELEKQQELLDELAGAISENKIKIKNGSVPFFRSLVEAAMQSSFKPNRGAAVLAARKAASEKIESQVKADIDPVPWCPKGAILFDNAREKRLGKQVA